MCDSFEFQDYVSEKTVWRGTNFTGPNTIQFPFSSDDKIQIREAKRQKIKELPVHVDYTWDLLKRNVSYIKQNFSEHLNDEQLLLIDIFTIHPPRRSKDYSHMVVLKEKDRQKIDLFHNAFVYDTKKFVFKNSNTVQEVNIDEELFDSITAYLQKRYELERGKGDLFQFFEKRCLLPSIDYADRFKFTKQDRYDERKIRSVLSDEIGKRFNIPFGINALRHLYGSHLLLYMSPQEWVHRAYQMGTSVLMLASHYMDKRKEWR